MKILAIDGPFENQEIYLNEFQANHLLNYHFITLLLKRPLPKVEPFYGSKVIIEQLKTVDYYLRLHVEFDYVLSIISN